MRVSNFVPRFAAGFVLSSMVLLGACSTYNPPVLPAASANAGFSEYRLGLGDKLRINVFNEPNLSGEFQVTGDGTVNMPLIGNVKAEGLTADQLDQRLTAAFAEGYLKDPRVVVEVYDFRPFFIRGEVANPGRYEAVEGLTLQGAIATAGDYTYRADESRVFIRRAGDPQEYQVDANRPLQILPGDVIRIGERSF